MSVSDTDESVSLAEDGDGIELPSFVEPPPARRTSWRMFAYLLREFLGALGLCVCAFLMLFLIETLFDDLPDFLKHGGSLMLAVRYFVLVQPEKLVFVLPMAVLLASMYTISALCRYNELTALSASGLSLGRVCVPIWISAVAVGCIQFVAAEHAAPRCSRSAEAILSHLTDPKGIRVRKDGNYLAYRNKSARRVWLFEDFQPHGVSNGVIVTSFREDGTAREELRAETARYEGYWLFENVSVTTFDKSGQLPDGRPVSHDVVPMRDFDENPGSLRYRFHLRPAGLMSIAELRRALDARGESLPAATISAFRTQLWSRWTAPLACLVAVLLGVPLAVVRERKAPVWSFVTAAGMMGGYYLAAQVGLGLARSGSIPVAVGAILPAVIFCGVGGWLTYQRR